MKEAAGEANMTVITIILIGVIAAIAIPLVTSLMNNAKNRTCCTDAGGVWSGNACVEGGNNGQTVYNESAYKTCIGTAEE